MPERDRPAGAAEAMHRRLPRPWLGWWPTQALRARDGRGGARSGPLELYDEAKVLARTLDLLGL